MSINYPVVVAGTTPVSATEMNIRFDALDKKIAQRNNMIVSTTASFTDANNVLTWNAPLDIYLLNDTGTLIKNILGSSNITINADQYLYLDASNVDNTQVLASAINRSTPFNPVPSNRFVLGYRHSSGLFLPSDIYPVKFNDLYSNSIIDLNGSYRMKNGSVATQQDVYTFPIAQNRINFAPRVFHFTLAGTYSLGNDTDNVTFLIRTDSGSLWSFNVGGGPVTSLGYNSWGDILITATGNPGTANISGALNLDGVITYSMHNRNINFATSVDNSLYISVQFSGVNATHFWTVSSSRYDLS